MPGAELEKLYISSSQGARFLYTVARISHTVITPLKLELGYAVGAKVIVQGLYPVTGIVVIPSRSNGPPDSYQG